MSGFFKPCFPLVRRFEGDSANFAFAEVGEDVFGGFLVVNPSAAEDCAAFFGYPFKLGVVVLVTAGIFVGLVAFLQHGEVVAAEVV